MSKALTKAQTDLDTLRQELEAWIASQPATPKPVRKPAAKRTRVELIEAATSPVVDVDTSWLDLLSPVPVAVPTPAVEPTPVPLYVDATHLIRIDLDPPHILDFPPAPQPTRRKTFRESFREGYRSTRH